jgi:phosphoribosyl 1,2-cyclic phosphodiesterase
LLEPDVLVLETGWFEHDKQGNQIIPTGHWIRKSEASFEETLELVQKINPRLAIATHIEELNGRSYADYLELEKTYKKNRLHFAYDGLRVSL